MGGIMDGEFRRVIQGRCSEQGRHAFRLIAPVSSGDMFAEHGLLSNGGGESGEWSLLCHAGNIATNGLSIRPKYCETSGDLTYDGQIRRK